jgi:hypothetical protein
MQTEMKIPACVTVRCYRYGKDTLQNVDKPADADVVRVEMPGVAGSIHIDTANRDGEARFWLLMEMVGKAYAMGSDDGFRSGRRDVIDKVGMVFANPRVQSGGRGA